MTWSINGRFLTQRVTGVQRYATQLVHAMGEACYPKASLERSRRCSQAPDLEIVAPESATSPESSLPFRRVGRKAGQYWEQISLPRLASKGGVLSLCNTGPIVSKRHVLCIHDTNVFLYPQSYSRAFRNYYRVMLPLLGRSATKILTVSNTSAELLARCGIASRRKIQVVPNGHEHVFSWDASRSTLQLDTLTKRPFVLVIGSQAPHKNIELVYKIAPELAKSGVDVLVSGTGGKVFCQTDSAGQSQSGSHSNVHHLGYVTDDDLAKLYSNALCLLFPSFVEGFGLPLVEALAFGCPIVSSDASCMPEICADHARYASPHQPSQWVDAVRDVLQSKSTSSKAAIAKHLTNFSWKKSAGKLLSVLEELS